MNDKKQIENNPEFISLYRHVEAALHNEAKDYLEHIPAGLVLRLTESLFYNLVRVYDPFWFCSFDGCEGACKECKDTCEMSIFVKERKKTAKKILDEVSKHYGGMWLVDLYKKYDIYGE